MPLQPFKTSQSLSVGVELELQLVSLSDFDLVDASPDMLDLLGRGNFPGNVVPEITESMIEVSTDVQTTHDGLSAQLCDIRDALVAAGDVLNVGVCGGGTHPFQQWSERRIFSGPRFRQVSALYGYLAKQFTIFGQHVHIGCTSGDEAMFLLHSLNRYVPHFIALSASSPYVQGNDTLFDSARLNSVFAFPLSGRAPFMLRNPKGYDAAPLRDDILATVQRIRKHAEANGGTAALNHLEAAAHSGSDSSIRERFKESGSAHGIVDSAISLFRTGCKRPCTR